MREATYKDRNRWTKLSDESAVDIRHTWELVTLEICTARLGDVGTEGHESGFRRKGFEAG